MRIDTQYFHLNLFELSERFLAENGISQVIFPMGVTAVQRHFIIFSFHYQRRILRKISKCRPLLGNFLPVNVNSVQLFIFYKVLVKLLKVSSLFPHSTWTQRKMSQYFR